MTTAKIIADSISPDGVRISSIVIEAPRFILAEINTHRAFSRSFASSRAIPTKDMLERIEHRPFIPSYWGKNQKGMQADEELTPELTVVANNLWKEAAIKMVDSASALMHFGIHKQTANRLLEPFSYVTGIITSTEWDNFFKLRLDPVAQPEFRELAELMKQELDNSTPSLLQSGEWHLPFINLDNDLNAINWPNAAEAWGKDLTKDLIKISVARCARVSYGINERLTTRDIKEDLDLYDKLLASGHWSPFEHQSTPARYKCYDDQFSAVLKAHGFPGGEDYLDWEPGITAMDREGRYWSGNFRGHIQNRQLLTI